MRSKKLEYDRQGLAVRLQEAMDDRDMSRDVLAVRSGYSLTSINRVFSGGGISLDMLVTLCELLNAVSWTVVKEFAHSMIVRNRITGEFKVVKK